jgi:RNA-directed DNA polymerase
MNSNRPKHTEPTSSNQKGVEDSKGPVAPGNLRTSESLTGYSDLAFIEKPALNSVPLNLMEQIVEPANFECAWARVKANRGAPGPDGITIDEFPEQFRALWPVLRQQLLDGTYKPGPVRRKSIPKADGGERHLGIATMAAYCTPYNWLCG